jgi:predicted transcriptional regulator
MITRTFANPAPSFGVKPTKAQVLSTVQDNGGKGPEEIFQKAQQGWWWERHAAKKLLKELIAEGAVRQEKTGAEARVFPTILKEAQQRLLKLLDIKGERAVQELASVLPRAARGDQYVSAEHSEGLRLNQPVELSIPEKKRLLAILHSLKGMGLVSQQTRGSEHRWSITPEGQKFLESSKSGTPRKHIPS